MAKWNLDPLTIGKLPIHSLSEIKKHRELIFERELLIMFILTSLF